MEESLRGRLLVAAPGLLDPNFVRTVVLMLEHNDDGALGVVLNRPTAIDVGDALPEWRPVAARPPVIFAGGPVGDGVAIGLARVSPAVIAPLERDTGARAGDEDADGDPADLGISPVLGPLSSVDLHRTPDELHGVEFVRVFAGYAGWGAGQIESELEAGGWLVVDALPDDALAPDPDDLWRIVLRRQTGALAFLANFPLDPRWN